MGENIRKYKEINTMNIKEINKTSRNWFFTINAHMDDDAPIKKEQIIEAFKDIAPDAYSCLIRDFAPLGGMMSKKDFLNLYFYAVETYEDVGV